MVKILKDMYGLIYGEMKQTAVTQESLHRTIESIKDPLRGREDYQDIEDAITEASCCSQESGFINGFKYGVAFMMECIEWPEEE